MPFKMPLKCPLSSVVFDSLRAIIIIGPEARARVDNDKQTIDTDVIGTTTITTKFSKRSHLPQYNQTIMSKLEK